MSARADKNQIHLYALPPTALPGSVFQLEGHTLATITCNEAQLSAGSFNVSFEQAVAGLQQLDRLFIELDGSFLWTGRIEDRDWQIDGMLYDAGERVKRVELKGCCPYPAWQQFLGCFDWPHAPLLAHWLEMNYFVSVPELLESGFFFPGPRAAL